MTVHSVKHSVKKTKRFALPMVMSLTAMMALTACGSHLASQPSSAKTMSTQTMEHHAMNTTHTTKTIASRYDFNETVSRLQSAFKDKNMTIFATIDHQHAAQQVDLDMQPAKVIVFGTPKAGTPLMKKDPHFALKLPLKVLVTETDGQVLVSFEDTHALIAGSQIDFDDVKDTLANAEKLIEKTVTQ